MELKCTNEKCEKEWDYKGVNKFYATCPDCKRSVKIDVAHIQSVVKEEEK